MKKSEKFKRQFQLTLWTYALFLFATSTVLAQSFEDLNHLEGNITKTFYSNGSKEQAQIMAKRCDNVISFYKSLIMFEPVVTLLVLSPDDWSKYTNFPVYGMPHYNDAKTLIVASEDNNFWKSFIPPLDQLSKELAQQISKTYSEKGNSLSMRGFFDLLAIHELGHAFHEQGGLYMQRKWMGELFANILLHTYIAEKEPELIPALTVFPQMVVSSTNKSDLKFTTLNELESNYDLLGQQYPNNYGWYQCRWHLAAGKIYDDGGKQAFKKLWQILKKQKEPLDDVAFANLLSKKVHQSVANVQLKWDE
ncbi:hypothetical protein FJ651_00125 [Paucihalobacter ruber]|uniref:Uncharacterized protein n=2 Tax=Paucihalobacter ruber TaxID=2567861 RepID=A0A506PQA2_9FLAO|nr:hypothetical protein FJ651_00125 [Paucihalobacter ruber]